MAHGRTALVLSFFLSTSTPALAADWVIVHAGWLLDRPGQAPRTASSVIVRDGRVDRIEKGYLRSDQIGAGKDDAVQIHDLSKHYVLPGLIDGHVHLTLQLGPAFRLQLVEMSDPDVAMLAAGHARRTLMAGFTSVRDLGSVGGDAIFALRDGIERGDVVGPRVFAAGAIISSTGGHGDFSLGYRDDIAAALVSTGICDGAEACRKAVRTQVRRGADHIKLTATAGVMSATAGGLEQQLTDEELEAIVSTAHALGRRVTAHAHGAGGIRAALKAGVDTVEHGTFLDAAGIAALRRTGAYLAPTLAPLHFIRPMVEDPKSFLRPEQREKAKAALARGPKYARQAHEAGVPIVLASDAGVFPHGKNAVELHLLVEWAGLTPMEAIHAATVAGAANLGQADRLGSLEPGKHADLVAVDGDPLADVRELEDVAFVMKSGVVYKSL